MSGARAEDRASASTAGQAVTKIRIRDLTKRFEVKGRSIAAVDGVSLDIPTGAFVMIVGPSGCGKTTLLRIVAGLEQATSGSMEIARGDSIGPARPVNAMIFQGDSIFPWMTVRENAGYGLAMRRAPRARIREVVGLGEGSKIAMVAVGAFFPIAINTVTGVLEISPIYLDVGRNFQAGRWQTFRTIALPGALPFVLTGVRLGLGLGLVLISVTEMVGSKRGLGYLVWNAWEILSVETMYVGLFAIALIGIAIHLLLNEVARLVIPWRAER